MENIGILTLYYRNYNYGGLLQAYALQRALFNMGYHAEQISYVLETGYEWWNPVKAGLKRPLVEISHRLKFNQGNWYRAYKDRQIRFDAFAETIPHTKVVTAQNIASLNDKFDCFVCGSDQIWNPIGWQPTLFLNFLSPDRKRISYAASIARDALTDKEYAYMERYLGCFSAVSVREQNSADLLNRRYPSLNVQAVPDPVFLLQESDWRGLIPVVPKNGKPYIFAYFLGESSDNREEAIRFAEHMGLEIRFVSYLNYQHYGWDIEHQDLLTPPLGVEEFLKGIANAELVLTDSFHAAAFSSILRTPFYALPRFKTQDRNSMNSRIENLVYELEITDRYTDAPDAFYQWTNEELHSLNENLFRLRERGMHYLADSMT